MKHFSSWMVVFPFLLAPLADAKSPVAAESPVYYAKVRLPWGATSQSLGVEPEGGRFLTVLQPQDQVSQKCPVPLRTDSRNQISSTLAIYAGDSPVMGDRKPITRLDISGPGRSRQAVDVMFKRNGRDLMVMVAGRPSNTNLYQAMASQVEAVKPGAPEPVAEAPGAAQLIPMKQLTGKQLRSTMYDSGAVAQRTPARGGARHDLPPGIGERTDGAPGAVPLPLVRSSPTAPRSREFIGVRTAGGLVKMLFENGKFDGTVTSWSFRPLYTDQTTASVSLFVGTGPYIENNKLWQRYAIRNIPAGPDRRILVTVHSGFDPKVEVPTASLVTGNSSKKIPLTVKKPEDWGAEAARDEPQELRPARSGRLPATPGTRT